MVHGRLRVMQMRGEGSCDQNLNCDKDYGHFTPNAPDELWRIVRGLEGVVAASESSAEVAMVVAEGADGLARMRVVVEDESDDVEPPSPTFLDSSLATARSRSARTRSNSFPTERCFSMSLQSWVFWLESMLRSLTTFSNATEVFPFAWASAFSTVRGGAPGRPLWEPETLRTD